MRMFLFVMVVVNIVAASEAGSPTNRLGSDKARGQGSFGPSTGGPDLIKLDNYLDIKKLKKKQTAHLIRLFY